MPLSSGPSTARGGLGGGPSASPDGSPPPMWHLENRILTVSGTVVNGAGTVVSGATVKLFRADNDQKIAQTTSGADGTFVFWPMNNGVTYYVVAYLAGSPDIEGTTINTLIAS